MYYRKKLGIDRKYSVHDGDYAKSIINILDYPSDLAEDLERLRLTLKHPQLNKDGLSDIEWILRRLEDEARAVLKSEGFTTDFEELLRLNDIDMGLPAGSARAVIMASDNLRSNIKQSDTHAIFFNTLFLISSALKMDAALLALLGSREYHRKIRAASSSKKPQGLLMMLGAFFRGDIDAVDDLEPRKLWQHLKDTYSSYQPLIYEGYQFYFDGKKLVQVSDGKDKDRSISYKTFEKYFYSLKPR